MHDTEAEIDLHDIQSETTESPIDPQILLLAETAREYVERAVGIELDFTPETLPILDHYLSLVRENAATRAEVMPLIAAPVGAYFGTLVARHFGGSWHIEGDDPGQWVVYSRSVVMGINPVGVVLDVLLQGAEHDGPSPEVRLLPEHVQAVGRRLNALPQVRDVEYFMMATRFEVLELVHDELLGLMQRESETGVVLDWADYEVLFRKPAPSA